MKKLFFLITIILRTCQPAVAQIQYDTVIQTKAYTSYFSFQDKCPVMVVYKLYHGGGNCDRMGDVFKNSLGDKEASDKDYNYSGYDKGHMANSKDFAFDCALQEGTFRYFNACPQTPTNNRGIWKHYETEVRKMSQTDSLLVICYNHFSKDKMNGRVSIPDTNYKVVYSLTTNHIVLSLGTTNNALPVKTNMRQSLIDEILEKIKN